MKRLAAKKTCSQPKLAVLDTCILPFLIWSLLSQESMLLERWKATQGTLHNDERLTRCCVYAAALRDPTSGEQTPLQFLPLTMLLCIVRNADILYILQPAGPAGRHRARAAAVEGPAPHLAASCHGGHEGIQPRRAVCCCPTPSGLSFSSRPAAYFT